MLLSSLSGIRCLEANLHPALKRWAIFMHLHSGKERVEHALTANMSVGITIKTICESEIYFAAN